MSIIVTPLHEHFDPVHLDHVTGEMRRLGPPRLRGHFDALSGAWFMREGTHRLRAAKALGITPILVPIPWWRNTKALERARYAARRRGHIFEVVEVAAP